LSHPLPEASRATAPDDDSAGGAPVYSPTSDARGLALPPRLVTETRTACREAVLEHVERALGAAGDAGVDVPPAILLDLRETIEVDASGLGVLVLAQKRARERGTTIRLLHAPESVRRLLVLTKLDHLFEFAE